MLLLTIITQAQFELNYSEKHNEYYGSQTVTGTFTQNNNTDTAYAVMFINNNDPCFIALYDDTN